MKISVNQNACISCGICIDICPAIFRYNDEFKSEAIQKHISHEYEEKICEAKDVCPVDAITID